MWNRSILVVCELLVMRHAVHKGHNSTVTGRDGNGSLKRLRGVLSWGHPKITHIESAAKPFKRAISISSYGTVTCAWFQELLLNVGAFSSVLVEGGVTGDPSGLNHL